MLGQRRAGAGRAEGASSELDHCRRSPREDIERSVFLELPKGSLAARLEHVCDRRGDTLLDDRVDRDEGPSQSLGEPRPERRLPGAHEADESQVPV